MGEKIEFVNESDYDDLKKIVENDKAAGKRNNGFKIVLYSLFICLINKYRGKDNSELFIVNGKGKANCKNHADSSLLHYALASNNVFEYHKMLTHVSYIKFCRRLKLIIYSIRYNKRGVPFGYFLDYILWREFFNVYKEKQIGSSGHYDRLTTQIALLSVRYDKKYYMRQHGLIGHDMRLPHKIPVSRVIAFDYNEANKFKNEVILNSDCVYQIEYISSVDFEYTEKCGKRIGIIDTPINEMVELVHLVEEHCFDAEQIIMSHPLSNIKNDELNNDKFKLVRSKKKELNYDVIFSGPSTLVYDYVRQGFSNPIIVYVLDKSSGLCDVAKIYSNVIICYSLDEFDKRCEQIASGMN